MFIFVPAELEPRLWAEIGVQLQKKDFRLPQLCETDKNFDNICLAWDSNTFLKIKKVNSFCHDVVWNVSEPSEDCFDYEKMNWYGGSELYHQYWPVENVFLDNVPFVTSSQESMGFAEPFWINSKGLFISVPYDVPLFVDSNSHRLNSLCLISNSTYPYNSRMGANLKYTICQLDDPRKAHEFAIQKRVFDKPSDIPDKKMIKYPIWSTWVKFKANVNETAVMQFAENIVYHGFNYSQIEIDDNWETCYGSMEFNKTRFPNMKSLSTKLKKFGFRITIWRHPFVNTNCPAYPILKQDKYFVKGGTGFDTVNWWDGTGSVIDFTNSTVKKWFQYKHQLFLEKNGIDGFKFDAGESSFLPKVSNTILK